MAALFSCISTLSVPGMFGCQNHLSQISLPKTYLPIISNLTQNSVIDKVNQAEVLKQVILV